MATVAIGAKCVIRYMDNGDLADEYFSFVGIDDCDEDHDAAGVPDHEIYYFADGGEPELKALIQEPSDGCMNDFVVVSYDLVYAELNHE